METEPRQIAAVEQHGASVTVTLGDGFRQFQLLLLCLIAALFAAGGFAVSAEIKAQDAVDAVARVQRQADLANWTMNNLEGLIQSRGIAIPSNLQPHNFTTAESHK